MRIGAIIQARMGSTRLPRKVLKKIGNKNILEHILFRTKRLKHTIKIVVATSNLQEDQKIVNFCANNNISSFMGSQGNVLERYYLCAKEYGFEHIVRLTGDNPFVDMEELDNLIELHLKSNADYSRSLQDLPKGVGSEIFSFYALEQSYLLGHKENHKEHVNEYIEENEKDFKISQLNVAGYKNRPEISLTVDTQEDYQKACFIVEKANNRYITTKDAIELCLQYA